MSTIRRSLVLLIVVALILANPRSAVAGPTCLMPPVAARVAVPFRAPACRPGVAARAAASGTVVFAGQVAGVVWVTVDHGGGLRTSYGPLRRVTVRRGATVASGAVLATAAGPLHFGVRIGGRYVDPAGLLGRPVHLVPRLFSPSARIPRPAAVHCGRSAPLLFPPRSR
jgi:hypothetical protein